MSFAERGEFDEYAVKEAARKRQVEREGLELAEQVTNFLNTMNDAEQLKAFVAGMSRQHRTLQQEFTGLCLAWFKHLSELPEHGYDMRNEHSVKVAKKIRKLLEDELGSAWSHTPFI